MLPWPSQMAAAVSSQELSMARMTGAAGMGATVGANCGVGKAGSGPVDVDGLDLAPCAFGDAVEG